MSETDHDIPQSLFDKLERYHLAEMSEAERTAFEKELNNDSSLKNQLEYYQTLVKGVELGALKDEMENFHQELLNEPSKEISEAKQIHRKWPITRYLSAAAVILVAIIGGMWLFNRSDSNEDLFAKHFNPDPGLITVMSTNEQYEFSSAMVAYKQGNYDEAIKKWEALLSSKPQNDTLNYFLGVANLASGNEDEAIGYLSAPSRFLNSAFESEAHYYLGLAHLKAGNLEDAKNHLSQSKAENSQLIISEIKE